MTFLDIIELWNIEHNRDIDDIGSMFENIVLDERLDKDVLVTCLLDECGAMESLYNTTPTFKVMSDNFFKKYQWNITKLADTLHFEYDPLKNKSLEWIETTDIEQNLDTEEEHSDNRTKSNTGTQTNEYDATETNTISAMNSSTYEPDNETSTDSTNTRTDNLLEGEQKAGDRNKSEDLTWAETDTHKESGTSDIAYQDLIDKERKVAQFSLYGWITKKYAHELFLLVY